MHRLNYPPLQQTYIQGKLVEYVLLHISRPVRTTGMRRLEVPACRTRTSCCTLPPCELTAVLPTSLPTPGSVNSNGNKTGTTTLFACAASTILLHLLRVKYLCSCYHLLNILSPLNNLHSFVGLRLLHSLPVVVA